MGLMEEVLFEKKSVKEGGRQQREDKVYPRPGPQWALGHKLHHGVVLP